VKSIVSLAGALLAIGCSGDAGKKTDDGTVIDTGNPAVQLPDIYINEFMASNSSTLPDESGAFPDWVELYNNTDEDADLSGWWLTDNNDSIFKWQVPDGVSIPPRGFLVIFCDNDTDEGPLHASFNLSADGEDLGLYGPNIYDNPEIDAIDDYGLQLSDVSLARTPDGSPTFEADDTPTPGASNGGR